MWFQRVTDLNEAQNPHALGSTYLRSGSEDTDDSLPSLRKRCPRKRNLTSAGFGYNDICHKAFKRVRLLHSHSLGLAGAERRRSRRAAAPNFGSEAAPRDKNIPEATHEAIDQQVIKNELPGRFPETPDWAFKTAQGGKGMNHDEETHKNEMDPRALGDSKYIKKRRGVCSQGLPTPTQNSNMHQRAAPPERCQSCNRLDISEWRRGPDGARTLCNACGLHYAKLTRQKTMMKRLRSKSTLYTIKLSPT
jgi:hypothetical protein